MVRQKRRDQDFFADLLAGAFFFVAFFFAAVLVARFFFLAGPLARRSASSSAARSTVRVSTESPVRSEALVSPSVTYGPKRPSFTTTGLPLPGSSPSSFSGAAAR